MLMTRLLSDPPCGSVFHQGILLKMNIQNGITQDEIVHKVTKCSNMGRDCAPGLLSYRSWDCALLLTDPTWDEIVHQVT